MSSRRITTTDIKKWLDEWNEAYPALKLTYTASTGYVAIGFLGEYGSIDVIADGTTAREAWEMFSMWRAGLFFGAKFVYDTLGLGGSYYDCMGGH